MNKGVNYSMFYDILLNLREYFHSYGRIDDSNAKLDEIIKLICTSYSLALKGARFNLGYVRETAKGSFGDENRIAAGLRAVFQKEVSDDLFFNDDGTNIFGSNPSLSIQPTEDELAQKLVSEIEKIDFVYLINNRSYSEFDLINECFGHFVRENFRNNKEDAQYMTPYEISKPVLDIIFDDMDKSNYFTNESLESFIVMDPTCGVGTLLIESSNHFTRFVESRIEDKQQKEHIINSFRKNGIIGQDKVDRMVRLSKVNALLLGSNTSNINSGNSIVGKSGLEAYNQKVDLIFTNPPFGAEYYSADLDLAEYPILSSFDHMPKVMASELLLLDRCTNLLRDGGYLAIVLPDSVFASKGLNSQYRDVIMKHYDVLGVIGLPSVTFAQAGTRTNTCILVMRKAGAEDNGKLFMADCKDLGYVVKERAGVPVKIQQGTNEMEAIALSIISDEGGGKILSEEPSVTMIDESDYVGNILKPSFYAASRFKTIAALLNSNVDGYKTVKLSDVVDFVTKNKKSFMVSDLIKHISVLHINANCTIAFDEVKKFSPVSKGRKCERGELIFSKINPRIPRMAVIPEREYELVCSNEFEIMKSKGIIGMHVLCLLLKTDSVKTQIENLTSGTSSSHSRIKREQLADILIPIPSTDETRETFKKMDEELRKATEKIYYAEEKLEANYMQLNAL